MFVAVGLSFPDDPVSIVFNYVCPRILGDASYAQYVLQFIAYRVWPVAVVKDPSFFLFLMAASLYAVIFIQQPIQKRWQKFPKYVPLALPVTLMSIVLIIEATHKPSRSTSSVYSHSGIVIDGIAPGDVGDKLIHDKDADTYDYLLRWQLSEGLENHVVINPTMLYNQESRNWLVAARAHRLKMYENKDVEWNGLRVTEIVTEWSSTIVTGTMPNAELSVGRFRDKWFVKSDEVLLQESRITRNIEAGDDPVWGPLCQASPSFFASNSTLFRKVRKPDGKVCMYDILHNGFAL